MYLQTSLTLMPSKQTLPPAFRAGFSDIALDEMEQLAELRNYLIGQTVVGEGDPVGFAGLVISGALRLQKSLPDGRQQIVGLILPGEMFCQTSIRVTKFAIEAASDSKVYRFRRHSLDLLSEKHPAIRNRVFSSVSEALDFAQDWMLLLGTQSVAERIATFLMMLDRRQRDGLGVGLAGADMNIIEIPVGRRDMATYLGTTVESVSRSIQKLARDGVIDLLDHRIIRIRSIAQLASRSGRELASSRKCA